MFADTLLESSPATRKRKRWPMATAFTVETIIAAVVVIVPLLSTGVIPLSARVQPPVPLTSVPVERAKPAPNQAPRSGTATSAPQSMAVVLVSNNPNRITIGPPAITTTNPGEVRPETNISSNNAIPNFGSGNGSDVTLDRKPLRVSELSQAQLLRRVEPIYPRMAVISGVQGDVKLHAIIARDGSVISLNLISGHPLLARAAEDAVSQWRYRPYILNGQAVEVETFITVHFTRDQR